MTPARGRFISLEGGEGVGKSTQVSAIASALRARGIDVVETREPGGSAGAETIRALLLSGESERWTARTEALLFAAARADHVARRIAPALDAGKWVVSDRFVHSSIAYQGLADGIGETDIRTLHQIGSDGLMPDRAFILTLPEEEAMARAAARDRGAGDRIGGRDQGFHARVAAAFRRIAGDEPERVHLIDASGEAQAVTARLMAMIETLL